MPTADYGHPTHSRVMCRDRLFTVVSLRCATRCQLQCLCGTIIHILGICLREICLTGNMRVGDFLFWAGVYKTLNNLPLYTLLDKEQFTENQHKTAALAVLDSKYVIAYHY